MSISVINQVNVKVPLLLASDFGVTTTSQITWNLATAPPNPDTTLALVRASVYIASPTSATGESAIISIYGTDPQTGLSVSISSQSIGPGTYNFASGIFVVGAGASISLSIKPVSDQTFLSTCSFAYSLEAL